MQSKVNIIIPDNNNAERSYIIDIMLYEFLGLEYELHTEKGVIDYTLILSNGNRLIIRDSFFGHYPDSLSYLSYENIPSTVVISKNKFLYLDDLPVIFGGTGIYESNKEIVCDIDIFASAFFMLTRWEEYVIKERDIHGRFSANYSLACKFGFLDRSIVNEYTEFLWNMIYCLDKEYKRAIHSFEIIPTHDVDVISCWHTPVKAVKRILSHFLHKRKWRYVMANIISYMKTLINKKNDPYNTFDFLLDYSESLGLKSYFFFMSSAEYSLSQQDELKEIAATILERGHHVGFHPNKDTCSDIDIFGKELYTLNGLLGRQNVIGRQHLLKFEIPFTWRIWNDHGMKWDSSLVYYDKIGFRCGVCYPYSVFDIIERKQLDLKELPLLAMDCTIFDYNSMSVDEALSQLKHIKRVTKNYGGKFVILWHNSYFSFEHKETLAVYKDILKDN